MVTDKVKMMHYYQNLNADRHLKLVFEAVWELGKCRVKKIKEYIENKAKTEAQSQYENGLINKSMRLEVAKKNLMIRELIHRKLKELVRLGLVEHIGQDYVISDAWIGDLRFFVDEKAREFGQGLLGRLTQTHHPTKKPISINLRELLEIFGFFMLSCMVEACRPVPFQSNYKYPSTPNLFNDKLAIKWFSNVLDPLFFLDIFISAISNQIDNKRLQSKNVQKKPKESHSSGNSIDDGFFPKGPPSTAYFHRKRFIELYSDKGRKEYYHEKKTRSMYLLTEETYKSTADLLDKLYPDFSRALKFSKLDFFGKPKEFSLKNRYSIYGPREVEEGN